MRILTSLDTNENHYYSYRIVADDTGKQKTSSENEQSQRPAKAMIEPWN